jgi:hypothetical protein
MTQPQLRLTVGGLLAFSLAVLGWACGNPLYSNSDDCSGRTCTLYADGTCSTLMCADTNTTGNRACAASGKVFGSSGVDLGGNCTMNGTYSEFCKAGLTCFIDLSSGAGSRSAGVCVSGLGRCPLLTGAP